MFILFAIIFFVTFIWWKLIEKIRVPRLFISLFLWLIFSIVNIPSINNIIHTDIFSTFSDLWMYFLLFIIWLEINIKELFKQWKYIWKFSFSLVATEAAIWVLLIHFLFWLWRWVSALIATSFATVWEAVLLPILEEFKLLKTKFWQTILWISTFDDIIEIIVVITASLVLWSSLWHANISLVKHFLLLWLLFFVPLILVFFDDKIHLKFKRIPYMFLFWLAIFFAFLWVWNIIDAWALWAIFAWISLKTFLAENRIEQFESIIKAIAYGFLWPIFFVSVWANINLSYLIKVPLLIIIFLIMTWATKAIVSIFFWKKHFSIKESIVMWIWLCAKFSTSIVIITLLLKNWVIWEKLYSVLIWNMILSQLIIPILFTYLLKKRNIKFKKL